MQKARNDYHFLTYVHPLQFHKLHSYYFAPFGTSDFSTVQSILTFINPLFNVGLALREDSIAYEIGDEDEEDYDEFLYEDASESEEDAGIDGEDDSFQYYKNYLNKIGSKLDEVS